MKKNTMMRIASVLLVAVLLSTSVISGTFAKYTSSVTSNDSARVAKWGFTATAIDISDLFKTAYIADEMHSAADAIAPGTTNSDTFNFTFGGASGITAPEVAYTFTVSTADSFCDALIQGNKAIQWKLDTGEWGTWEQLIAAIEALAGDASGTKQYAPNTLPTAFGSSSPSHTISWQWIFSPTNTYYMKDGALVESGTAGATQMTQDELDTYMGNMETLEDLTLKITVTATQLDSYSAS